MPALPERPTTSRAFSRALCFLLVHVSGQRLFSIRLRSVGEDSRHSGGQAKSRGRGSGMPRYGGCYASGGGCRQRAGDAIFKVSCFFLI